MQPNGIVVGVVSDIEDKESSLRRIKVTYPHLDDVESDWAQLVTLMAGKENGTLFRPDKGDTVLVAYAHGDPRQPYILGSVWNDKAPPPADDGKQKENNIKVIRTRSGHTLTFDDTSGSEKIAIEDKDEKRRIVIDCAGSKIQIECDEGDVEIVAGSGNLKIDAKSGVEVKSGGSMTLEASGSMTIKGSTVNIN